MCPKTWSAPAGIFPAGAVVCFPNSQESAVGAQSNSAKGPVSRILSCAVIPLGAALPRTLISDLPGGFGPCMEQPERAPRYAKSRLGASGRCAASPGSSRTHPSLFGLAPCGVYPAPAFTSRAVRSYRTISPLPRRWSFPQRRAYPASRPTRVLRFQGGPPAVPKKRGGVAEAVSFLWHWPSMGLETHVPDVIRHTALRSSDFPPPMDLAQARSHRQRPPGPPASSDFTAVAALNPCCHVPDSSPIPRC